MSNHELPKIIQEVGFDNDWDTKAVWQIKTPTQTIPIAELSWHFKIPFWNTATGWYDLSVNEVLKNPAQYAPEVKRIEAADTAYPIDICINPKTGRWTILDGLHRLAKLALHGQKEVEVRKHTFNKIPWKTEIRRPKSRLS
jgi:hypothetical protein